MNRQGNNSNKHTANKAMLLLRASIALLLTLLPPVCAEWPALPSNRAVAIRSQRDVSANTTVDQLSYSGVSLSPTVFYDSGYTLTALNQVTDLLDSGVQLLEADIYWHEQLRKFQLCPAPMDYSLPSNTTTNFTAADGKSYKCQTSLQLSDLANTVSNYLTDSDTNLYANVIILVFNMFSISQSPTTMDYPAGSQGTENDTISNIVSNYFGTKLYTPSALSLDRKLGGITFNVEGSSSTGWPTTTHFLFNEKKRIMAAAWTDNLAPNTTYDSSLDEPSVFGSTIFANSINSSEIVTTSNYTETALKPWRIAVTSEFNNNYTSDQLSGIVANGYSPVVNAMVPNLTSDLPTLLNDTLWSWDISEPSTEEEAHSQANQNGATSAQSAFTCASLPLSSSKWQVANCYDEKHVACRLEPSSASSSSSTSFQWAITIDKYTYFDAIDACQALPSARYVSTASTMSNTSTYQFSVPKSSLEQLSLVNLLSSATLNETEVWIDMNAIAIAECWVSGGPYASCPYQKVSSHRNFVEMMTPATLFCGVIFIGMLLLRLRRIPLYDNRKYWKKLVNEYAENEYEGVPS